MVSLKGLMNTTFRFAFGAIALALAAQASARVTFYEGEGFRGRAFTTSRSIDDFDRRGFNDRASSVVVDQGTWEVCDNAGFAGRCRILRAGSYDSLRGLGMDDRISSARPANPRRQYDNEAPTPLASPTYEYRRRPDERLFQATVTSVRAVVGPPGQRCWMERHQVAEPSRGERNVGGAILGGILGGVLGHQIGGGSGRDIATAGGVVAGAVIGSSAGRDHEGVSERNVRRCETTTQSRPEYWDLTYDFRGITHQVQLGAAPGSTVSVNWRGEPRQ